MSMTPQVPNFSQSMTAAKDFWSTKQGSFGRKVIIGGIVVVGAVIAFNLASILAFFSGIVWAGVNLIIASTVLAAITSPLWCPPVRLLIRNIVQSSIRWSYRKFVQKDPIGIMLNNRDQVRDEALEIAKAVEQLAGSKQALESDIQTQMDVIRDNHDKRDAIVRKITSAQSGLPSMTGNARMQAGFEIQQLDYSRQMCEQAAGIAGKTIDAEKPILQQTDETYDNMSRILNLSQFKVQSLTMQADMYSKQRKSILAGQRGLIAATRVMNGDPHQLDLLDMAIETVNEETASVIGAMKNFNRTIGPQLTDMSIDNDAKGETGRKLFTELEQKLALPPESIVGAGGAMPTVTDQGVVVPSDNDYMKFLK